MNSRDDQHYRRGHGKMAAPGVRSASARLILIGMIIGFAGALYYAWILEPVVYTEASPGRLNDRFKEEYILLVSESFAADGNWELTQARLEAMGDAQIEDVIIAQLEAYLRSGKPAPVVRNLARLAQQLGGESPAINLFVQPMMNTPGAGSLLNATPSGAGSGLGSGQFASDPVITRPPTGTPLPTTSPTSQPSPTAVPVYRLLRREEICLVDRPAERIEVIVVDPLLEPQPGAEILVHWEGGSDRFFTGYHPDQGPGYADFGMKPDEIYTLEMAEGSLMVDNLRVIQCPQEQGGHPGGWRLTFQDTDVQQETPTPLFQ